MLRIVIYGLAAIGFGLCSGWLLLAVMSGQASPTTAPATISSPSQALPAPPTSVPVPRIRPPDTPTPALTPAPAAAPEAEPTPAGVTRQQRRNRQVRRRDDDDDD